MALYTNFEQVRLRLIGKVRFTESEADENKMPVALAQKLINEAEGQVELDLSPRYAAPFTTVDGAPFAQLPQRPTREYVVTMCELQSVMRILETDFGSGSAVDGAKYAKEIEKRYIKMRDALLQKPSDRSADNLGLGWFYPPLPGLKLNWMNETADDGFKGSVIVASGTPTMGYAAGQINNPAENFWNSVLQTVWD